MFEAQTISLQQWMNDLKQLTLQRAEVLASDLTQADWQAAATTMGSPPGRPSTATPGTSQRTSGSRSSSSTDRLMSRASVASWCGKPAGGYGVAYAYDNDGRATYRVFPADAGYTGQKRHVVELDWDLTDGGSSASASTGSVFRWARVNGFGYEYFYDASGRRRLKAHPAGGTDEYFYAGGSMIEDRGVNDDLLPDGGHYPIDEYIWLDGRPVVMVRTKFSASWQREADVGGSTDCMRNGEPAACGVYFIVSDYLPKPVAMLDDSGKLAGTGDYDPYGHVNRVTLLGDTQHPYAASSNVLLGNLRQPPLNAEVQVRPRLALLDTESVDAGWVYVADIDDNAIGPATCGGTFDGGFGGGPCENWYTLPGGGVARIRFKSTSNAGNAFQGVVLEGYEFRRYQPGASAAWTPLRFPGQYHDAETDLFENWNRFYDPSIGRYLTPDPLISSPTTIVRQASLGMGIPTYAYARNNPIGFNDPDGLAPLTEAERRGLEARKKLRDARKKGSLDNKREAKVKVERRVEKGPDGKMHTASTPTLGEPTQQGCNASGCTIGPTSRAESLVHDHGNAPTKPPSREDYQAAKEFNILSFVDTQSGRSASGSSEPKDAFYEFRPDGKVYIYNEDTGEFDYKQELNETSFQRSR